MGNVYSLDSDGICRVVAGPRGDRRNPISNFSGRIATERAIADGISERREFHLEVTLNGTDHVLTLTAEEFLSPDGPVRRLGTAAQVAGGRDAPERLRLALQAASSDCSRELTATHLGWMEIDGKWCYLHAGGCIGASPAESCCPTAADRDCCNHMQSQELIAFVPIVPIPGGTHGGTRKVSVRGCIRSADSGRRRRSMSCVMASRT